MKSNLSGMMLMTAMTFSSLSYSEDFSSYSNDDLFGMRDQVRSMDDSAKDAYRSERQGRMGSMDQSERDSRFANMGASGKRNMDQMGSGRGNGRGKGGGGGGQNSQNGGSGGGKQHRYGQGNTSGSGNQYRYGQGNDSGSGNNNQYGYGGGSNSQYGSGGGGRRYGGGR